MKPVKQQLPVSAYSASSLEIGSPGLIQMEFGPSSLLPVTAQRKAYFRL